MKSVDAQNNVFFVLDKASTFFNNDVKAKI